MNVTKLHSVIKQNSYIGQIAAASCSLTSHSAYVATETELYGAKIDGLFTPIFL